MDCKPTSEEAEAQQKAEEEELRQRELELQERRRKLNEKRLMRDSSIETKSGVDELEGGAQNEEVQDADAGWVTEQEAEERGNPSFRSFTETDAHVPEYEEEHVTPTRSHDDDDDEEQVDYNED